MIVELLPLVLMSPETAVNPPWRNVFTDAEFQQRLALIAVDEAHCIFEWWGVGYISVSCMYMYDHKRVQGYRF